MAEFCGPAERALERTEVRCAPGGCAGALRPPLRCHWVLVSDFQCALPARVLAFFLDDEAAPPVDALDATAAEIAEIAECSR